MTSEQRILIELTDIVGVEFECPKCNAKVLYPFTKHYDRLLSHCPNCNETWFDTNDNIHPSNPQIVDQVANMIGNLRKILCRTDIHAYVRLQVSSGTKI